MKGLDTQGWQIQLAKATYPLVKKSRQVYPIPWYRRLTHKLDQKSNTIEKVYEDTDIFEKYPKGRLKHMIRQMDRLEYYLGLTQIGGEHGGLARSA